MGGGQKFPIFALYNMCTTPFTVNSHVFTVHQWLKCTCNSLNVVCVPFTVFSVQSFGNVIGNVTVITRLFNTVLNNRNHVLHQLLPPIKLTPYDLRTRSHNHSLPRVDNNLRKNFIYRLLYKNIYWNNIPLLVARILCYYLCFVHVRQSYVNKVSTIQYKVK